MLLCVQGAAVAVPGAAVRQCGRPRGHCPHCQQPPQAPRQRPLLSDSSTRGGRRRRAGGRQGRSDGSRSSWPAGQAGQAQPRPLGPPRQNQLTCHGLHAGIFSIVHNPLCCVICLLPNFFSL